MKFKKIGLFAVALISTLLLAGCGNLGGNSENGQNTAPVEVTDEPIKGPSSPEDPSDINEFGYVLKDGVLTFLDGTKTVFRTDKDIHVENVRSVIIPNSVTTIGEFAFRDFSNLTSITIPDSVTSIREYAFYDCSSLTSIRIPESVTSIESSAFSGCKSLSNITIPNTIKSIGNNAFSDCKNITSITIPDSVTSIGDDAFRNCGLTSIEIPNSVTSIGNNAFYECPLEKAVLPAEACYFWSIDGKHSKLKEVIITSGEKIKDCAFRDCSNLTSITIPDSVTSIGDMAFYDCSNLTSIRIPYSATSIGDDAFHGCYNLEDVYFSGTIEQWIQSQNPILGYYAKNLYLKIDDSYELISGDIVIPNTITKIANYTFSNCKNITSITIPDSVTSIGNNAFYGCTIEKATIPAIACGSIINNNLKEVVITSGETIEKSAFIGCSNLKSITIRDSVTSIESSAFAGCKSLSNIIIPDSVTSIGDDAFRGCSNLTSIRIPYSVTSIGDDTFSGCSSLASITIPDSVTSIGDDAFRGCSNLTSIRIPDSVTSIGYDAFSGCPIEEATIPTIACSSIRNSNLKEVVITSGEIIKSGAFQDCTKLMKVTLPSSVRSIESSVFENCISLTSITIPAGITNINDYAFENCYRLVEVINLSSLEINKGEGIAQYALNVKTSGDTEIVNVEDYLFYDVDSTNYMIGYVGNATELTLPYDYKGKSYVINDYAFYKSSELKSVAIIGGVTSIGRAAFSGCINLINAFVFNITSIGDYAFYGCYNLIKVVNNNEEATIGLDVFRNCYKLVEKITNISDSKIENVDGYMFYETDTNVYLMGYSGNDKELILPSDYKGKTYEIYQYAFYRSEITSITFSNGATSIGDYAFYECKNLLNVNISDSVTSIGKYAFYYCTNMRQLTLGDGLTSIGEYAFVNCHSLYTIDIPKFVTNIGKAAFCFCSKLEYIILRSGITSIGEHAFSDCYNLKKVYYTYSLKHWNEIEMGDGAIYSEAIIYIYSSREPSSSGNYWYYDADGNIVEW